MLMTYTNGITSSFSYHPLSTIICVFRLQAKSLHTIEELKEMCETLFLTFNEQAQADYQQILALEQEIKENPFLEV